MSWWVSPIDYIVNIRNPGDIKKLLDNYFQNKLQVSTLYYIEEQKKVSKKKAKSFFNSTILPIFTM